MLNESFCWSSFANAYLRENTNWEYTQWHGAPIIIIMLDEQRQALLPIHYFSDVGIHHFTGEILLCEAQSQTLIEFEKVLHLLLAYSDKFSAFSKAQIKHFIKQFLQSQQFIRSSLNNQPNTALLEKDPLSFIEAEQSLFTEYNLHPTAKSRALWTRDEYFKYSPECVAKFKLVWLKVSRYVLTGDAKGFSLEHYINTLAEQSAPELAIHNDANYVVIPMHPWQWQYLIELSDIQLLLNDKLIIELGEHGLAWSVTSSVNTVCQPDVDYQLIYALNNKLTNSGFSLSVKDCKRSLRVFDACQTTTYQNWRQQYPEFNVLQEPAWCAITFNEKVIEESIFIFRENRPLNHQTESLVLARLGQLPINNQSHLLLEQLKRVCTNYHVTLKEAAELWFRDFSKRVIVPLCDLQANLGLVCLAQQHRIVIEFAQGLPSKTFIRDCQEFGFSKLGVEQFSAQCKESRHDFDNQWSQTQISRDFPYHVIINTAYTVIAALSRLGFGEERYWCQTLRASLAKLLNSAKDNQCLLHILENPYLECKGNFYCCLNDGNESSLEDPTVVYFDIPNLLAQTEP